MKRLKERWGVKSNTQVIVILIVFAVTGTTSAKLAKPLCEFLHIYPDNFHPILYWTIRILIILPIYNVLLIIIGTLFGQYTFFKRFLLRTFRISK